MNKRDFYKELMSEYMFDKEKICANAKRGKFAGQRSLPIYIGMTAAVAGLVVTVGTVTFTMLGDGRSARLVESGDLTAMSDKMRIQRAIDDMVKNAESTEEADRLVTFTQNLSPSMAKSVLSKYFGGSIPVTRLYMADGAIISTTNEIGTTLKNNTGEINAVVIRCSGYLSARIQEDQFVFLVETVTAKDLENDNLAPVKDTSDPIIVPPLPTVSEPVDNTSSNVVDPVGSELNNHEPDIDDPGRNHDTPEPDETSSGSEPSGSNSEPPTGSDTPGNSDTPDNNSDPGTPVVDAKKLPAGVTLPMKASKPAAYITDDIGAQRAYFLSEDVFYVKTESAVKLYKYNGESETLAAEQEITDAKVTWVSANGLRLMVSGTENGVRRKLYIVDAKNCTINDMQIDEMLGEEGSISEAAYNESADLFVLSVLDDNSKYIFTANLSGYHPMNQQIIAYGSEYMFILAARGSSVYYSEVSNGVTVIYKSGELENTAVKTLDSLFVSTTNPAFTHAIMIGEKGMSLFDPATESLIDMDSSKNISFGASAHSFSDGSSYFAVSSGAIVPEGRIAEIAKVDFTRSFSSKYAAAISNGSVRIIPSVYTKQVKSDGITFELPTENATSEQREAVNFGIGAVNAIASGTCKECGINTAEKLVATIESCFGESAAQEIIQSCKIAQSGELSYTSGSLTQISVSDTILVMENETSGKIYIKVGTFEGKTAYTVRNVTLVDENGLKLGAVI